MPEPTKKDGKYNKLYLNVSLLQEWWAHAQTLFSPSGIFQQEIIPEL